MMATLNINHCARLAAMAACAYAAPVYSAPASAAPQAAAVTATSQTSDARRVSTEDVHAVAAQALSQALARQGYRAEVRGVTHSTKRTTPDMIEEGAELQARPLPEQLMPSAQMPVWVDVRVRNRFVRSVLVPLEVQAYQNAWVAKSDLPAGTRLDVDQLQQAEVDVARQGHAAWQGDPQGQVLRTPLMAGQYVSTRQTMPAAPVLRGDRVIATTRSGGVEINAPAVALQDGKLGQQIQVRVDSARAPTAATVVQTGRVEVQR